MGDVEVWPAIDLTEKTSSQQTLHAAEFGLIFPAMGEPWRVYEEEREMIRTMLTGSSFNKLH